MAAGTVAPETSPRDNEATARKRTPPAKRFWTPPAAIGMQGRPHPSRGEFADVYRGTKAELIAAGFLADGMFPGDPGMPHSSVTHYPQGAADASWFTPWACHTVRNPSGSFTITLMCAEEEQRRRCARRDAQREASRIEREAIAKQRAAERRVGPALDEIIAALGAEQVMKVAARLHRQRNPLRCRANLRLVWSAPVKA
ncbi:MAG: hypothetical protein U1F67_09055 [Rubrivivax sp.]